MLHNVLIIHTRADEKAAYFKNECGLCYEVKALSLFDIKPISFTLSSADYYIVTSANAVPFLPPNMSSIIAVGDATRNAFKRHAIAYDNFQAQTIMDLHAYKTLHHKKLVHLGGVHQSQPLHHFSAQHNVAHIPIYEAQERAEAYDDLKDIIRHHRPDVTLFFSPRGALVFSSLFTRLIDCDTLNSDKALPYALGLSQSVHDALGERIFEQVITAKRPDMKSMVNALKTLCKDKRE